MKSEAAVISFMVGAGCCMVLLFIPIVWAARLMVYLGTSSRFDADAVIFFSLMAVAALTSLVIGGIIEFLNMRKRVAGADAKDSEK